MIDALVKHLRATRRKLSENEMQANEHLADFQSQMIKENKYLRQKIVELNKNLILRLLIKERRIKTRS